MAIFSGSFSYEQMAQTMARIDRQGQENPVVFHSLVATDTVDELVVQVLQDKESNQKRVLEQIKEYARAKTSDR
jgi:SNF2 family DNA or RNA helicase